MTNRGIVACTACGAENGLRVSKCWLCGQFIPSGLITVDTRHSHNRGDSGGSVVGTLAGVSMGFLMIMVGVGSLLASPVAAALYTASVLPASIVVIGITARRLRHGVSIDTFEAFLGMAGITYVSLLFGIALLIALFVVCIRSVLPPAGAPF